MIDVNMIHNSCMDPLAPFIIGGQGQRQGLLQNKWAKYNSNKMILVLDFRATLISGSDFCMWSKLFFFFSNSEDKREIGKVPINERMYI